MSIVILLIVALTSRDTPARQRISTEANGIWIAEAMLPQEMPKYKPPKRILPGGRVGTTPRGRDGELITMIVCAPNAHTGLTSHNQPILYWYLSRSTKYPTEFTVLDDKTKELVLEARTNRLRRYGIQSFPLADFDVHLLPDRQYIWSVSLIPNEDRRAEDIYSAATIAYVSPPTALLRKLNEGGEAGAVHIYAKEGFWYDAFMSVTQWIERTPEEIMLRKYRTSLLEQIGLSEIARDLNKIISHRFNAVAARKFQSFTHRLTILK